MSMPEVDTPSAFRSAPPALRPVVLKATESDLLSGVTGEDPYAGVIAEPGKRAVIYLRVSSKGQVNTDYDPEGISIPAQRVSCTRKADQLGLTIVGEYLEPGRSGTEMTKRIAFQQMLERIRRDRDVDYVIVYKLSRSARNRTDDAIVMADLQKRGVTLISATEQIDDTPVGQLMHGILAAFNEYRSREDGADIAYKMAQKAKNGGTIGRAPIGYENTIDRTEGREIRTVGIDPVRAPFVKLAFELYATNDYTFQDIADELTERGLTTRPTARRPAGPISDTKIQQMLRDRYYLGEVTYKGESFKGRHEPLISTDLFEHVQRTMDSRGVANERRRVYTHYLKGSLWCGHCRLERDANRRLIQQRTVGRHGGEYWYFFCRGSQDGTCDAPFANIDNIEAAVEEHYKSIELSPEFIQIVRDNLERTLRDEANAEHLRRTQLKDRLTSLQAKEDNLLDLAADGSLPQDRIRHRLREIGRERDMLQEQLNATTADLNAGKEQIEVFLDLLTDVRALYIASSDEVRQELNQAIFNNLYVAHDDVIGDDIKEPLRELLAAQRGWAIARVGGDWDAANASADAERARHTGPYEKRTATSSGSLGSNHTGLTEALLTGIYEDGDSSETLMVEVARQCSNLASSLQRAISTHRMIRRRPMPAAISREFAQRPPCPVPRLTEAMLDEAERRYRAGEILRLIAGDLGVSRQRLAERLRERGVRLRGEQPSPEQVLEMCRRYEQGESLARVGAKTGFNASTVRTNLLRAGVALRDPHGRER